MPVFRNPLAWGSLPDTRPSITLLCEWKTCGSQLHIKEFYLVTIVDAGFYSESVLSKSTDLSICLLLYLLLILFPLFELSALFDMDCVKGLDSNRMSPALMIEPLISCHFLIGIMSNEKIHTQRLLLSFTQRGSGLGGVTGLGVWWQRGLVLSLSVLRKTLCRSISVEETGFNKWKKRSKWGAT